MYEFWLKFHLIWSQRVQSIIFQHWFRESLGTVQGLTKINWYFCSYRHHWLNKTIHSSSLSSPAHHTTFSLGPHWLQSLTAFDQYANKTLDTSAFWHSRECTQHQTPHAMMVSSYGQASHDMGPPSYCFTGHGEGIIISVIILNIHI